MTASSATRAPRHGASALRQRARDARWARREIATLDPIVDHERYAHLVLNVRLGDPPVAAALYTVAFIRQMAIPSIAQVVHRGGRSPIMTDTRKRNNDSLFFFGEFMRLGPSSAQGAAAVARVREIHTHFPIENDQQLFTLSSLMFEGAIVADLTGVELLSGRETAANFWFWRSVGEGLGLADLPNSVAEGRHWMKEYERTNAGYTAGGAAVAEAMLRDYELRMPRIARPAARALILAFCGPELRAALRLDDPGRRADLALRALLHVYRGWLTLRPDPADRAWSDAFRPPGTPAADYGNVGYQSKRGD